MWKGKTTERVRGKIRTTTADRSRQEQKSFRSSTCTTVHQGILLFICISTQFGVQWSLNELITYQIKYDAKYFYSPSYESKKSNVSLLRNANERRPKLWAVLFKGEIQVPPASQYHLVHIKAKNQGYSWKLKLDKYFFRNKFNLTCVYPNK